MGDERNPVIVIDDFAPDPEAMRAVAARLEFVPFHDQYYPGTRAIAPLEYYRTVGKTITGSLREFFECRKVCLQQAYYSLATTPITSLSQAQRLPHYDTVFENYYAAIHFLCPPDYGGTAFFRQRRTGFETVNAVRQAPYLQCLEAGLVEHGGPQPHYAAGDTPLFDQIGLIEARWNRAVIFRGNCLHSGAISNAIELPDDPLKGRLTVVSFLIAE
jgi:hypothetical protein